MGRTGGWAGRRTDERTDRTHACFAQHPLCLSCGTQRRALLQDRLNPTGSRGKLERGWGDLEYRFRKGAVDGIVVVELPVLRNGVDPHYPVPSSDNENEKGKSGSKRVMIIKEGTKSSSILYAVHHSVSIKYPRENTRFPPNLSSRIRT